METAFVILWLYSSVPFTIGTIPFGPGWLQAYQFKDTGVCEKIVKSLNINVVVGICLPAGEEPEDAAKPL